MSCVFINMARIPLPLAGCLLAALLTCVWLPAVPSICAAAEETPETPSPVDSATQEEENSAPEQTVYPGVVNERIQRGGDGKPAISLYYPVLNQAVVDADIRRWATDVADAYEEEAGRAGDGPDGEKPASYGMWDLTGLFELSRPCESVVSVTFNVYSYTGGAHGNLNITCLNYDLRTGRRLSLADMFKDPEKALQLMSAWSLKELVLALGEDAQDDMLRDGVAPDLNNFSNLTLTPQGLRIEFQPYQVAPWSAGPQRVDMPLSELAAAGPEALIWPHAPVSTPPASNQ
ncbi:DUF3298 and DUF4163 domain-containing protein [uncultured Desulfovibrio sp.]|uniref:DUF3298 and DUF4163 domain-containing protein n=1 Tax=uncultured Desulfovibrio sp. TaxID=167968 RepID=UPI00272B4D41|nr:DUF3298 and DUF4163 domain-containing protein [uncultured Desulfovibrio sp.]